MAATADWVTDVIAYRLVVGVLGVLALTLFVLIRRSAHGDRWRTLPPAVTDTIALTMFGVSGVWTLGLGLDSIAVSAGNGSGQWLSAALVALIGAFIFGARLFRQLRHGDPAQPEFARN
jgi:uncharacterized membrane protein SirB2